MTPAEPSSSLYLLWVLALLAVAPVAILVNAWRDSHAPAVVGAPLRRRGAMPPMVAWSIGILILLLVLAVLVLAGAVDRLGDEGLWALATLGITGLLVISLVRALVTGRITALLRSAERVTRRENPVFYWLSFTWNLALTGFSMSIAVGIWAAATNDRRADENWSRCLDGSAAPAFQIAACNEGFATVEPLPYNLAMLRIGRSEALAAEGRDGPAMLDRSVALRLLDEELREDPDDTDSLLMQGLLLIEARRHEEAVAAFTRAEALDPGDVWPRANRALAHAHAGRIAEAEADIASVMERDPGNWVALNAGAIVALRRGQIDAALGLLDRSAKVMPDDPWATETARALRREGVPRQASVPAEQAPASPR